MLVGDLKKLIENLPDDIEVLRSDSEYGSRELHAVSIQFKTDGGWTYDTKEQVISSWFGYCQDEQDEEYRKKFEESIQKVVVLG